ncbi:MAG TPA: DUF2235 domain-containing protein [Rhodanobacteraceae bacterium]|nr:DUF2235 domain-containing protein [Rhodanobacteraceae bacterium]
MPRRLVLLFDGTWNKASTHTNVEQLSKLVAPVDALGNPQVCNYVKGVGVAPGVEHLLGGAFGLGLSDKVKLGFKWLSESWRPADEIWLFGFSRGAYTARSLGGLIRKCGLLPPGDNGSVTDTAIDDAYAFYRNKLKPGVDPATGVDPTAPWRAQRHSREVAIHFIGVWDTVGSLGIPGVASWFPFSRKRYAFHDTDLSKLVKYAYQALAIDEHRPDFKPTKRERLPDSPGASALTTWKPEQIEVEQRWFVGAHADVGGGEKTDGAGHAPDTLPEIPLAWMQAKAAGAGLAFTETCRPVADAELAVPNDSYAQFMFGIYKWFKRPFDRVIGGGVNETIDGSVWAKWNAQPRYRPDSVTTALDKGRVSDGSDKVRVQAQ